jgi:chaperone BCS1
MQTNHIDRLDPALMRPGRIDRRIRYTLATGAQARGLFERLFKDAEAEAEAEADVRSESVEGDGIAHLRDGPQDADPEKIAARKSGLKPPLDVSPEDRHAEPTTPVPGLGLSPPADSAAARKISDEQLTGLAQQFAAALRDYEFSPAELQGYLLSNRERPIAAAAEMGAWVARQRAERQEKEELKAERKERVRAARAKMEAARAFHHQQQYAPYPPFPGPPPPPPLALPPPNLSPSPTPTPTPPPNNGGDADETAVPPAAPLLAAAPTIAPASPPSVPLAIPTPDFRPTLDLDYPGPPLPKIVNGINGTA